MNKYNEKLCPICKMAIKSDANVHDYCTLCGMGISTDSLHSRTYKSKHGNTLRFCCYRCLSIFKEHISNI